MSRPKLLDLYSCEGGGAKGYMDAGFDTYGVDLLPRFAKRYPGAGFHAGDVLEVLRVLLPGGAIEFTRKDGSSEWLTLADFDAIHASPPCQRYSITNAARQADYPDLIGPTRDLLVLTGLPWVIENVVGAPLIDPVSLTWPMFYAPGSVLDDDDTPLTMLRERLFESNIALTAPAARVVPGGGADRRIVRRGATRQARGATRAPRRVRAGQARPGAPTRHRLDDAARPLPVVAAGLHRVDRAAGQAARSGRPGGGGGMTHRARNSRTARMISAVRVVCSASARTLSADHRSSGMRTLRAGVSPMSAHNLDATLGERGVPAEPRHRATGGQGPERRATGLGDNLHDLVSEPRPVGRRHLVERRERVHALLVAVRPSAAVRLGEAGPDCDLRGVHVVNCTHTVPTPQGGIS